MFTKIKFCCLNIFLFLTLEVMAGWSVKYEIAAKPLIYFGVIPYKAPNIIIGEFSPLVQYLGKYLDMDSHLRITSSYENLSMLIKKGYIQIGWFSQTSYQILSKHQNWEIIARPGPIERTSYRGAFIVKNDSRINSLFDLKGKSFAYVDRNSGAGFIYPNKLLKEMGIKPLSFFRDIFITGSHSENLKGVLSGKYDGASVYDNLVDVEIDQNTRNKIKILAKTPRISTDVIIVPAIMAEPLKVKLRGLFKEMANYSEGRKALSMLKNTRGIEFFE